MAEVKGGDGLLPGKPEATNRQEKAEAEMAHPSQADLLLQQENPVAGGKAEKRQGQG